MSSLERFWELSSTTILTRGKNFIVTNTLCARLDSAFSVESRVAFFHFFFPPHFTRFAIGQGTTSTAAVLYNTVYVL